MVSVPPRLGLSCACAAGSRAESAAAPAAPSFRMLRRSSMRSMVASGEGTPSCGWVDGRRPLSPDLLRRSTVSTRRPQFGGQREPAPLGLGKQPTEGGMMGRGGPNTTGGGERKGGGEGGKKRGGGTGGGRGGGEGKR